MAAYELLIFLSLLIAKSSNLRKGCFNPDNSELAEEFKYTFLNPTFQKYYVR